MLDHPSCADSCQRESLGEIVDYRRLRQPRRRFRFPPMVDRVIYLVTHKLDAARRRKLVQVLHLRIAHRRPCGVVRAVQQDQLGSCIRQLLDLFDIDAEGVLFPNPVETSLEAKRFGKCRERREAGPRQDYIASRLSRQPYQDQQRL